VAYRIVLRQDIAENWTENNPTLLSGEFGFETDTNLLKLGNGIDPWITLEYWEANVNFTALPSSIIPFASGTGGTGGTGLYDLGSGETGWRDIYALNKIYVSDSSMESSSAGIKVTPPTGSPFDVLGFIAAPATAGSTGSTGQIAYDYSGLTGHFYVCVDQNTWLRTQLTTF
jgi:hypothetical protein